MYHYFQNKFYTKEQDVVMRLNSGSSQYIEDFLTDTEFEMCRQILLRNKTWPEVGTVSKYYAFDWDNGPGKLLRWLKPKIDKILPNWKLDFLSLQEAITPWKIHSDLRWEETKIPYKVILLPMDVEPVYGPVTVDQWPETYTVAFRQRNYLIDPRVEINPISGTYGNNQDNWIRPYENPQVERLIDGYDIDKDTWKKHFDHMPYDHMEGLTIDALHLWKPKSLFYWDNSSLHCADNFLGHDIKTKRCLMIFTLVE